MPSPFPGLDPFLESQHRWQDFHARFINYWSEAISDQLPNRYVAVIEEQVEILEYDADKTRLLRPDILIAKRPNDTGGHTPNPRGGAATLEAVNVPFPVMEEVRHRWIEILREPDRELVAVLELLSPTNKTNPGRGQYLAKRSQLYMEDIHLIELDLLLDGLRLPMGKPLPPGDFFAIIARAKKRPGADVYAWTLRDPIPAIPIPLSNPDKDMVIDLAAVFTTAYERGRYARMVDYARELSVPLDQETLVWAHQIARQAIS